MTKVRSNLFLALLFHAGWLGCIGLATTRVAWISLSLPIAFWALLKFKFGLRREALIAASVVALVGVLFDSLMLAFGFIETPGGSFLGLIPVWLISIWMLFSLTLIQTGPGLSVSPWILAALGAVFGPLSYRSGEIFKVLFFGSSYTFAIYALFWALAFPGVVRLSKRYA